MKLSTLTCKDYKDTYLDYVGVNMAFCDDINSNTSNQELNMHYGCVNCTQLFARRVFGRNKKW